MIGIPTRNGAKRSTPSWWSRPGASLDPAELIGFCNERIAGYKCPRSVDVRTEALPMSGAGKILKRELRRPFWENQDRRVA